MSRYGSAYRWGHRIHVTIGPLVDGRVSGCPIPWPDPHIASQCNDDDTTTTGRRDRPSFYLLFFNSQKPYPHTRGQHRPTNMFIYPLVKEKKAEVIASSDDVMVAKKKNRRKPMARSGIEPLITRFADRYDGR